MPSAEAVSTAAFKWSLVPLLFVVLSYYYPAVRRIVARRAKPRPAPRRVGSGVAAVLEFNRQCADGFVNVWRSLRRPAFLCFLGLQLVALLAWVVSW